MKNKMQNVSFKHVDDLLEWLPKDELKILQVLRHEVFSCIPQVNEKCSYNVPFYSGKKSICYIWPGSVWWGKKQSFVGVQFGFTRGHLLTNPDNHFEMGNRKQVISRIYQNPKEIDLEILRTTLFEAALLDTQQ
jgi:hypothetical protein